MAKIMIVDDSLFIRGRVARMLMRRGYEVTTAEDGLEAVTLYEQLKPDVVVMDITMPRMQGLEALAELRRLDPQAKVIMLTALDQPAAAVKAVQLGAKEFLAKPVDIQKLVDTLERVLR